MKGWFDAFRHDGGPTLYDRANRTAVTGDTPTITLCVVFITLFVAFLIVFPGIRSQRLTTFASVTLSLFVGAVILVCNFGSEWHTAEQEITSAYRAFSSEKIVGDLGVHIGFDHVNVSLRSFSSSNGTDRIDYNERFKWIGPDDMHEAYEAALRKGLPYPILTVVEYLSLNEEGFSWGRTYRYAGYLCGITLWTAFASWLLMNILLVAVPSYGAYMMLITGGLMLLTNFQYYMLMPSRPLVIRFEDNMVTFSFGWCFWLVLASGALCVVVGSIIAMVEMAFPHKFSTVLELDYGTPYDRHIIIEESHDRKYKRPRLEEPSSLGTFGSRIFRRLSKRNSGSTSAVMEGEDPNDPKFGLDNPSMELDPPKSPWRYPHNFSVHRHPNQGRPTSRTESRKSTKSVNFREISVYGKTLHPSSAALSPPLEAPIDVEIIPDVPPDPTTSDIAKTETQWDSDSSVEEEQEVERVQDIPVGAAIITFQNQLRAAVSRQNSHDSRRVDDDWNEPETPVIVLPVKSALHKTSSTMSSSGRSTPKRKGSNEDDSIQLDRSGSHRGQKSFLASVSARMSAAVDADRQRSPVDDDSHRVDLW